MDNTDANVSSNNLQDRFEHILKPIKSLPDNWDVNIKAVFADYWDVYVQLVKQQHNGVFNFAEAALFLQGVTQVYARKVEYVFNLVKEALKAIHNTKLRNGQDGDDGGPEQDNDGTNSNVKGPRRRQGKQPWSWLEKAASLNGQKPSLKKLHKTKQQMAQQTDPKQRGQHTKPCMPMALLPLDDFEKGDLPLWPVKGEAIGRKDDFRVNNCVLHENAALLLDLNNIGLIDQLDVSECRQSSEENEVPFTALRDQPVILLGSQPDHMDPAAGDMSVDAPFDDDDAYETPMDDQNEVLDGTVAVAGNAANNTRSRAALTDISNEQPTDAVQADWSKLLMPVDDQCQDDNAAAVANSRLPNKPLKRKPRPQQNTNRIINNTLKEKMANNRCRSRAEFELYGVMEPISDYVNDQFFSLRKCLAKSACNRMIYPGLESLVLQADKTKADYFKRWLNQAPAVYEQDEHDSSVAYSDGGQQEAYDEYSDNDQADEPDMCNQQAQELIQDDDVLEDWQPQTDGQSEWQAPVCLRTYEQLVTWHLQQHMKQCGLATKQTDMAKRVAQWQERVQAVIQAQSSHRQFDVNVYAQEIVDKLYAASAQPDPTQPHHDLMQPRPFVQLFKDQPKYEVCRFFLSGLMLANRLHVQVGTEDELLVNSMHLALLKPDPVVDMCVDL